MIDETGFGILLCVLLIPLIVHFHTLEMKQKREIQRKENVLMR